MRIAMVSEHADPTAALGQADAGGQNVHVAALSQALAARGHTVVVYTRRQSADTPDRVPLCPGVTVERVKAGPLRALPKDSLLPHMAEFGDRLGRIWRDEAPDVIHAHFWMSGVAALQAAAGLSTPIPVTETFHALGTVKQRHQGTADSSPSSRIAHEQAVALRCDQIIATCTDEVNELTSMGVSRHRISVVPCGVSAGEFHPQVPPAPRTTRFRLVTVGRLVPRKGVDTIISALAELPATELVVAGGPPPDRLADDAEVQRLWAIAARDAVADRVTFTGGIPHDRIPRLLRSADIVVTTPWYEPFGIVPLEAMACGVPVIASAVGGLTDTVVHGVTGLHVPPQDPAALAAAARTLLADPGRRAEFGRAGVGRVRRWYDWGRVAAQTEAVYARVAGAAAQPDARRGRPRRTRPPAASRHLAGQTLAGTADGQDAVGTR